MGLLIGIFVYVPVVVLFNQATVKCSISEVS